MSRDPSPLDDRTLSLLREEKVPPTDARTRVRGRLAVAAALPPRPSGRGGGATGTAVGHLAPFKLAAVALVIGGGAGAGLHAALTRPAPPQIVYVDRTPTITTPVSSVASPALAVAPTTTRAGAGESPAVPRPSSAISRPSQLTAERSLLDEVRGLILQGNAAGALDRLRESRREFPHPILGEEREALTIEALVGAHRYDEARALAESFREHSPDSLFSSTVDGAIRSIP